MKNFLIRLILASQHVGIGSLCYLRGRFSALSKVSAGQDWIVEGEEIQPEDNALSSSEENGHRKSEGLTIQPPNQSLGKAKNEVETPTKDRPRLRRIDTSERLRVETNSGSSSPATSSGQASKRSTSPSPLMFDRQKAGYSESPAKLSRRQSQLSMQELCRLQAQTPQNASFDTARRRQPHQSDEPPDTGVPGEEPEEFIVSCIIPNFLYLGPEPLSKEDVKELDDLNIKQILNMALEVNDKPDLDLSHHFEKYSKIPMRDFVEEKGVQQRIEEACTILGWSLTLSDASLSDGPQPTDDADLKSKAVFVHCRAGKSRSVTIVLAYLIHRCARKPDSA